MTGILLGEEPWVQQVRVHVTRLNSEPPPSLPHEELPRAPCQDAELEGPWFRDLLSGKQASFGTVKKEVMT